MASGDNPDLDLIGMVQRARMALDAETQPSQVSAVYWIEDEAAHAEAQTEARAELRAPVTG